MRGLPSLPLLCRSFAALTAYQRLTSVLCAITITRCKVDCSMCANVLGQRAFEVEFSPPDNRKEIYNVRCAVRGQCATREPTGAIFDSAEAADVRGVAVTNGLLGSTRLAPPVAASRGLAARPDRAMTAGFDVVYGSPLFKRGALGEGSGPPRMVRGSGPSDRVGVSVKGTSWYVYMPCCAGSTRGDLKALSQAMCPSPRRSCL